MILLNARSIRNKMAEFRCLVETESADIIAITESWVQTERRDFAGEFELPGYAMFKKDRLGRQGGGVLLYVKDPLRPVELDILGDSELIGVDIETDPKMRVLLVYRPPHQTADIDDQLYDQLTRLIHNRIGLVVGDFNCRVDWEQQTAVGIDGLKIVEWAQDNFLVQVVDSPTRGENILDLIFTTDDDLIRKVEVGDSLGTSDHNVVTCTLENLQSPSSGPSRRRRPNIRLANFGRFREKLAELPLPAAGNVESLWNQFKRSFSAIQSECIPNKTIKPASQCKPKWFTREIAEAIAVRKTLYAQYKQDLSQEGFVRLVAQRRTVKRLVLTAKRDEEDRVATACTSNPKEFFSYVNSRKPLTGRIGPLQDPNGITQSEDREIASILNDFFASVFTPELDNDLPQATILSENPPGVTDIVCTQVELSALFAKLKTNKSSGPDGYLPSVMKAVSAEMIPHLVILFNRSLEEGVVPSDMKEANVTPIFKKGAKDDPGNYRPISLTSVVGKQLESVIADRIIKHLETEGLLRDSQHGFLAGRSCLTNLLSFFHQMLTVYDASRAIDILYLDFKKAFDKVPHRRLLIKVRALGIGGRTAAWLQDWLTDRRQRVVINGCCSDWTPVGSGVPQGSVLGPLLFLIYINDLDVGLVSRIAKFADDTKLGIDAMDPESVDGLRRDLIQIGEWSEKWQMPFNVDKCAVMHIGQRNPEAQYSLLGQTINTTVVERDLGVLISRDLKFSAQCLAVEKRAQKILGYIKRQFNHRTRRTVLLLYNALVRPLLEYAVQFWSPTLQKDIKRLERVQARATKLIPDLRCRSYDRRLVELNMFTLEKRRLRGQLIETFKLLKGINKVDYRQYFQLSENTSTRGHAYKVVLQRFTTRACGDFMTYKICGAWNSLPENVVNATSVDTFKRRLDRHLSTP